MSAWLSVAITVILIVVAYLILNRNITARTSQQAALDEIKREVGSIITELNSTTERNIELIEDRIATLEKLIEEADRRVTVLRRELAGGGTAPSTYTRQGLPRRHPRAAGAGDHDASAPTDGRPPLDSESYVLSGNGTIREDPDAAGAVPPLRDRVRALYLQGLSLERIASVVGKTVGEVELIVSLDEGAER